jgi:hypothetical protein
MNKKKYLAKGDVLNVLKQQGIEQDLKVNNM